MSEASDETVRIIEYLSGRGQRLKHEARELLAGDHRWEGERHTRAAVLLVQAQCTLAICTELAEGAHHNPTRARR